MLVGADRSVRLSDFGMSRFCADSEYYRKTSDDRVPVKWMAPESINDRIYTNLTALGLNIVSVSQYNPPAPPKAPARAADKTAAAAAPGGAGRTPVPSMEPGQ